MFYKHLFNGLLVRLIVIEKCTNELMILNN